MKKHHYSIRLGSWRLLKHCFGEQSSLESLKLLHQALELGIDHIDTAGFYAHHQIEEFLGKNISKQLFKFSTKVGLIWVKKNVKVANLDLKSQLIASLKRLKRSHVETVLLHVPTNTFEAWCEQLVSICKEGLAKNWGVCNCNYQQAKLASELGATEWHLEYNLLHKGFDIHLQKLPLNYVAFSPFAQGYLLNKQVDWAKNDWRLSSYMAFKRAYYASQLSLLNRQLSTTQIVSWFDTQKQLDTVIIGPRDINQLKVWFDETTIQPK